MDSRIGRGLALAVCLWQLTPEPATAAGAGPGSRILTEEGAASILARLHPDYTRYIHALRLVSAQSALVSTEPIYSGLVRPGGREPRLRRDAPESGKGVRNDLVLFPAIIEPGHSPGWRELILDHEYFHARHLARGWTVPLVDFGDAETNRVYYEAVAWSYVFERAREGVYADLSEPDMREVNATYRRYYKEFHRVVMTRQASAWMHYGRFLVNPDASASITLASAPAPR